MTEPARWTVDDRGTIRWGDIPAWDGADFMHPGSYEALVADVRAARAHDTCHHTHNTLQRAREYAAKIRPFLGRPGVDHVALDALLDLLAAEGPDQTDGGTDG